MQQFMHANLAAKRREGAQRGAPSTSVVTLWGIATPTPRPPSYTSIAVAAPHDAG